MKPLSPLIVLLWLVFQGNLLAQPPNTVISPIQAEFLPLPYQLADINMQGRETGTEGEKVAELLAQRMKTPGIQPFTYHFYQDFQLLQTYTASASLFLTKDEIEKITFSMYPEQVIVFMSCAYDFDFSGEIVFAGCGLVNEDSSYTSFSECKFA